MTNRSKTLERWTAYEEGILMEVYHQKSIKELQEILPERSADAIRQYASRLGITSEELRGAKTSLSRKVYSANESYFSEFTPESCYWAGFLAADGNIGGYKDRVLTLGLQEKDLHALEDLKKALNHTGPVLLLREGGKKIIVGRECNTQDQYGLQIVSERLCTDLETNFNVTARKTLTLQPPSLPSQELRLAYAWGFLAGDGTVTFARTGRDKRWWTLRIGVYCQPEMVSFFQEAFAPFGNVSTSKANTSGLVFVGHTGKSAEKLYAACSHLPFLNRKREKFLEFQALNTESKTRDNLWSAEEDAKLLTLGASRKWTELVAHFPGRTKRGLRARFESLESALAS